MLSADPVGQLLFSAGQALTPSQFATAPFAAPALHSAHLAIHDRETKLSALAKLLTLGPSYFETCKYCVRPIGVLPTAHWRAEEAAGVAAGIGGGASSLLGSEADFERRSIDLRASPQQLSSATATL